MSTDLRDRLLLATVRVVVALGVLKLRHIVQPPETGARLDWMRRWIGVPDGMRPQVDLLKAMLRLGDVVEECEER